MTAIWKVESVAGDRTTFSPPSLTATVGTGYAVVAQGPENSLNYYWNDHDNTIWSLERPAGANTTYSAPLINFSSNRVWVVGQGISNSLDLYWEAQAQNTWHPEVVASDGNAFA